MEVLTQICINISEKLFIGNYNTAKNKSTLQKNNIQYILSVGNNMKDLYPDSYKYMKIEIESQNNECSEILFNFRNTYEYIC